MVKISDKLFQNAILFFFGFSALFITLRLSILGSAASETVLQFVFSALPDLFGIILLSFIFIRNRASFTFTSMCLQDKMFIFFIFINLVIGSIVSGEPKLILYGIRMTYFPMLFYFLFRFESIQFSLNVIRKIFILISMIGLAGIIIYFFLHDWMINMIFATGGLVGEYFIIRMTSIFWTPVVFSTCMAAAFIYFLWSFLKSENKIDLIHAGIAWSCLLLSVSRGSLVVVIFGFLILCVFCFHAKRLLMALSVMSVLLLAVAFYIGSPIDYVRWLISSTAETVSLKEGVSRVDLWIHALENFKEHPLGYGLGKAGHVAVRFYKEGSQDADLFSTDGWFLKLANEGGIIGLISYFTFAFSLLFFFIKRKFYSNKDYLIYFAFFAMFNVQNLVSNVFDFYFFAPVYWLMIGFSMNYLNHSRNAT